MGTENAYFALPSFLSTHIENVCSTNVLEKSDIHTLYNALHHVH